jgi:hypothetical protein
MTMMIYLLVIDTVFDYFEEYDDDDDFVFNENELIEYAKKQLRKDVDNVIELDDVRYLIKGELEYENFLNE